MSHAKQASTKRKRSINAVPVLSIAGLSTSLASGASAAIGRPAADLLTPKTGMSHEITLCEEEISDVSLGTFYIFDKEKGGTFRRGLKFAARGGCGCTPSDIRLKRDIAQVGELDGGINLYRYRYQWSDTTYVGVMAQEVAAVKPEAVLRGADGYLHVDYARLGLRLQTWDQWVAARYRRSLLARAEARCIAANIAHAAGDAAEGLTAKAHLTGDTGFLSYSE